MTWQEPSITETTTEIYQIRWTVPQKPDGLLRVVDYEKYIGASKLDEWIGILERQGVKYSIRRFIAAAVTSDEEVTR